MSDKIFDYSQVLYIFVENLALLREHIAEHQMFVGWEDVVEEIKKAEQLADQYFDCDDWKKEEELWNEFFDYLRDNMRKWWC